MTRSDALKAKQKNCVVATVAADWDGHFGGTIACIVEANASDFETDHRATAGTAVMLSMEK